MSNNGKPRVEIKDKRTIKTRTDLGNVMGKKAPTSTFVQSQPALQSSSSAVITSGQNLSDAVTNANTARAAYRTALANLKKCTDDFDSSYDLCVSHAEFYAKTPADLEDIGFTSRTRQKYAFVAPNGVVASSIAGTSVIDVEVDEPPGMRTCVVEISPEPMSPSSWVRTDGTGVRRSVSGFAPGTYWVRAANVRANSKSAYTTPVPVVVR
jgi:hypothetical protein